MCKSKTRTDATEPGATSRTSRRSKRSPSRTPRSSITDPSTSNITSLNFTTGSSYRDSSRNSVSSRTSLSGIRGSLPENPHIYDFSEISNATNNFLAKRHPPASAAWRCSIRGKDVIVFQRKLRRSIEASRLRELLSLICRSNHASLIKLLGVSISGNYIYFVYDYVNGANLKDCLRNPKNPNYTVLSTWMSRMKIATDLAEVVDYIHNSIGSNQSFVHNHITSASVIVTEPSFLAKLCHFGTAELSGEIPEDQQNEQKSEISEISVASSSSASSSKLKRSGSRIMKLEGTRGYMSPEFQSTGVPTQKSDVYAFGVVILELLSGQEPLKYRVDEEQGNYSRISVIETATEASGGGGEEGREGGGGGGGGRLRNWMDRRLKDSFPVEVAERMTRLALECVHVDPEMRPDMRDVAGRMSKLYLMSMNWADTMRLPTDFSVSLAPR